MATKVPWEKLVVGNINQVNTAETTINTSKTSFAIYEGTVQFGNLKMDIDQFETCLRHLMELTKEVKPEEFI